MRRVSLKTCLPGELAHILNNIPKSTDPNLLVGTETSDDAGIYRISDDIALVNTR